MLWGLAVTLFVVVPAMVPEDAGWIRPGHFVERHGLVMMVALGESVVAVGIGASHTHISWQMLAVATLGLMLSAELWWVYFGGDDAEAEGALRRMTPTRREFFDTNVAYYWAHLVMLLGIVCIAAGLERAIGHAFDSLSFARALELGGGTALISPATRGSGWCWGSRSSAGGRWLWRSRWPPSRSAPRPPRSASSSPWWSRSGSA